VKLKHSFFIPVLNPVNPVPGIEAGAGKKHGRSDNGVTVQLLIVHLVQRGWLLAILLTIALHGYEFLNVNLRLILLA